MLRDGKIKSQGTVTSHGNAMVTGLGLGKRGVWMRVLSLLLSGGVTVFDAGS